MYIAICKLATYLCGQATNYIAKSNAFEKTYNDLGGPIWWGSYIATYRVTINKGFTPTVKE